RRVPRMSTVVARERGEQLHGERVALEGGQRPRIYGVSPEGIVERTLPDLLPARVEIGDAEIREVVPLLARHLDVHGRLTRPVGDPHRHALGWCAAAGDGDGALGA